MMTQYLWKDSNEKEKHSKAYAVVILSALPVRGIIAMSIQGYLWQTKREY